MTDEDTTETPHDGVAQREEAVIQKEKKAIGYLILIPVVVVAAIVVLTMVFGEKKVARKAAPLKLGDMAPDFTFPDLDGNKVNLASLRGKVVFINIWATWCPPCRDEMPSMEKLYQHFKGRDFEILGVSIDVLGEQVVRPFMKELNLTFPALLDTQGRIKSLYATTGVPESFIVDKQGRIAFIAIGPREWSKPEFIEFFEKLVKAPEKSS